MTDHRTEEAADGGVTALHPGTLGLLDAVIAWHENELLPVSAALTRDPRCRLVQGDFFALAASAGGLDAQSPGRRFDAILVDIDQAPGELLDMRSVAFYTAAGLQSLSRHLRPGGIFGLWSNNRPDGDFTERLGGVFAEAWAEAVVFDNPLQGKPFTQTVYLARKAAQE